MSVITENYAPELELAPEFIAALRPILAKWETAIVRVAAAETRPSLLPRTLGANTPEGILLKRFQSLPEETRRSSAFRAARHFNSIGFEKRLNRFLNLKDLGSGKSVDALTQSAPIKKLTEVQLKDLTPERFAPISQPAAGVSPAFKTLRLDLFRMVCIDETNGAFGREWGEDEIELSGVALDETAELGKLAVVSCGDFDDGTRRDYSPVKRLFTFNLTEGATFPKSYFVTLLLVEADQGNLSDTVNAIIDKLKKEAAVALTALISNQTGAPPWLVSLAVTWLLDRVVNKIISIWEDDPFKPQTIELVLPNANATFTGGATSSSRVVNFSGPGEYAMRYIWTLSKSAGGS